MSDTRIHRPARLLIRLAYLVCVVPALYRSYVHLGEVLRIVAFILLGAAVGYGVDWFGNTKPWLIAGTGALSSLLSYLFSTSVWAYRAPAHRIPSIPGDWKSQFWGIWWDYPIACAIVVSLAAAFGLRFMLRPKQIA